MKEFIIESGNNVKLVTLAPEEENGLNLIKYLKEHNIIASVGHSNATFNIIPSLSAFCQSFLLIFTKFLLLETKK